MARPFNGGAGCKYKLYPGENHTIVLVILSSFSLFSLPTRWLHRLKQKKYSHQEKETDSTSLKFVFTADGEKSLEKLSDRKTNFIGSCPILVIASAIAREAREGKSLGERSLTDHARFSAMKKHLVSRKGWKAQV